MRLAIAVVGLLLAASPASAESLAGRTPRLYQETLTPQTQPVGTVLVIHGGGWQWVGKGLVDNIRPEAVRLTGYGWRTVNVDYRRGYRSLKDVTAWYDRVRAKYKGPLCAFGESAGAHLALMLAERRDLNCVIGHAAITDLRHMYGSKSAKLVREDFMTPSFGTRLAEFSPVLHPARPGRILLANSAGDTIAPCRQLAAYRHVRPATWTVCLPVGQSRFIHARVTRSSLERLQRRERNILARSARQ